MHFDRVIRARDVGLGFMLLVMRLVLVTHEAGPSDHARHGAWGDQARDAVLGVQSGTRVLGDHTPHSQCLGV